MITAKPIEGFIEGHPEGVQFDRTALYPPSTLLIGPAGTGKTTSLITVLEKGLSLRLLATEPSAPGRIMIEAKKRKIDTSRFDWTYVSPGVPKWDSLIESARLVNNMSLEDISKLRMGIAKPDGQQWIQFLKSIANFRPAQHLGARPLSYGDATEWDDSVVFAIDGLTGVSAMSRMLTVGLKPNPAPGEWGVMQNNILGVVAKLCADCKCFFVLIAHVERELNEITGSANLTVSTLGAKLAPKIPPLFTNVIYSKRDGERFLWSTADKNVDTKSGDLPISLELAQSFAPVIDSYRERSERKPSPVAAGKPQTTAQFPIPATA